MGIDLKARTSTARKVNHWDRCSSVSYSTVGLNRVSRRQAFDRESNTHTDDAHVFSSTCCNADRMHNRKRAFSNLTLSIGNQALCLRHAEFLQALDIAQLSRTNMTRSR